MMAIYKVTAQSCTLTYNCLAQNCFLDTSPNHNASNLVRTRTYKCLLQIYYLDFV